MASPTVASPAAASLARPSRIFAVAAAAVGASSVESAACIAAVGTLGNIAAVRHMLPVEAAGRIAGTLLVVGSLLLLHRHHRACHRVPVRSHPLRS